MHIALQTAVVRHKYPARYDTPEHSPPDYKNRESRAETQRRWQMIS
ncbi:MAG: hypothetical protein ACFB2X_08955 [Rivularia sp. (in: cyanobacteria)]